MARNPAVRKAAKAAKRKAVVAAKRKQEIAANSPAARIREAARMPVMKCLVSSGLFHSGAGVAVLVRGVSREEQHIASFMLDTFCLGVKDVYFRTVGREEAEYMLETLDGADPIEAVEPGEMRKLLHDLVAWAGGNGFPPHVDYAWVEALFGDVVPADHDTTPEFGYEGKVLYMPGPFESPAEVRRRRELVRAHCGNTAADMGLLALAPVFADEDDDFLEDELLEGEAEEETSDA
jgi:hypothetical protein